MGLALPQEIAEPPDPWPGIESYLEVFNELSAGRDWLMGMGVAEPLPIKAGARMEAAAERCLFPGSDEYEEFVHVLQHLDSVWMEDHAKRRRKKTT